MEPPLLPYAIPAGACWASSPGCLPEFLTLTLRNPRWPGSPAGKSMQNLDWISVNRCGRLRRRWAGLGEIPETTASPARRPAGPQATSARGYQRTDSARVLSTHSQLSRADAGLRPGPRCPWGLRPRFSRLVPHSSSRSGWTPRGRPAPLISVPGFWRLRRGLRLKDGPGSARAATVSVWLR